MTSQREGQEERLAPSPKNAAQLALALYELLEPYDFETRRRAIQAALTTLGDEPSSVVVHRGLSHSSNQHSNPDESFGPRARRWIQRYGLTQDALNEVFHVSSPGVVDIVAHEIPGSTRKEMTVNCYLLAGARGLLASDSASLDESEVIALCKRMTAYDKNNHTTNRMAVGNRMTGSRPNFSLTAPGEAAAADLIRSMSAGR